MAVTPASSVSGNSFSALRLKALGRYLDHGSVTSRWNVRVPYLFYPLAVGIPTIKHQLDAPPGNRPKALLKDALMLGLPTVATLWATHHFMPAAKTLVPTSKAALGFIEKELPGLVSEAAQQAKQAIATNPFKGILWHQGGQSAFSQQATLANRLLKGHLNGPHAIHNIEIKAITEKLAHHAENLPEKDLLPALQKLLKASQDSLSEQKTLLEAGEQLAQAHWPESLDASIKALGGKPDEKSARTLLFENWHRLLLPTEEDFKPYESIFKSPQGFWPTLKNARKETWQDIKKEAFPFFATGLTSISSGLLGGLLANKLTGGPKEKPVDIAKEGVFQFVSNVMMCALGASGGMFVANIMGWSRFSNPLLRLGSIAAGLGAGIATGTLAAGAISEKIIGPAISKSFGIEDDQTRGRHIDLSDVALHLDDIPTALSIAGMQIFRPWIPTFFAVSAWNTARGKRNEHHPSQMASPKENAHLFNEPTYIKPLATASGAATLLQSPLQQTYFSQPAPVASLPQPYLPLERQNPLTATYLPIARPAQPLAPGLAAYPPRINTHA